MILKVILPIFVLILSSCSTLTQGTGKKTDVGIWEGKVQMLNNKDSNRKWAYVTWVSDSPQQRMRIDIRAILDVPIASYIQTKQGAKLWLFTESKYFHSEDAKALFSYLVKIQLDPELFFSFLGNPKSLGEDWSCENKDGVYTCFSPKHKTNVSVDHNELDKRIINLDKDGKSLRMRLFRSKVEVEDQQFRPFSTPQFDTIKI